MIVDNAGMGLRAFLYKNAWKRRSRSPQRSTAAVAALCARIDALNASEVAGLP